MLYLKSFDEFNEKFGVTDWLKELCEYIYSEIKDNYSESDENIEIIINNEKFENGVVFYEKSTINSGLFVPRNFHIDENDKMVNVVVYIKSKELNDRIIETLYHEFTHIIEYYNHFKNNFKKDPKYMSTKKYYTENINKNYGNNFKNFIILLYISIDSELNSRVAEIYNVIKNNSNFDYDVIKKELNNHININFLKVLENFNHLKFINDTIEEIGLDNFIFISNDMVNFIKKDLNGKKFNVLSKIDNIKDKNDIIKLYKNFEKMFKFKANKHSNKIEKLIRNRKIN